MTSSSDHSGKELAPFLVLALFGALLLLVGLLFVPKLLLPSPAEGALPAYPKSSAVKLESLPVTEDVQQKKAQFFALLKPLVEIENQHIAQQRAWLETLDLNALSEEEQRGFIRLLQIYSVLAKADTENKDDDPGYQLPVEVSGRQALLDKLLLKVDTLPVELVLVQAANESAWGRSRFALQGNNLFGQWCFSRGCGLVPQQRSQGEYHEVAVFSSPQLSIRAYLNNLNSFWAYKGLRAARMTLRGEALRGDILALRLADHLERYSQRGPAYVKELKEMVQVNRALIQAAPDSNLR